MPRSVQSPRLAGVISEKPTRRVLRELRGAGFVAVRTRGSHTLWEHPAGVRIAVPDGHGTISPGVYRQVLAALARVEATGTRMQERED